MKKIFFMAVFGLFAVGCVHSTEPTGLYPTDHRRPSQVSDITLVGRVGFSESKMSAGYTGDTDEADLNADVFYTMQVDCEPDRILSREEQGRIIKISAASVSAAERRKFSHYKKRAERQNKDGNAMPYVKVTMSPHFSGNAVCEGLPTGKVYSASNARFSSSWKK